MYLFLNDREGLPPSCCWLPTMNTVLGRFNAVFAFALPVLALLTFLCFATVALKTRTLDNVRVSAAPRIHLRQARDLGHVQSDHASLLFDLRVDLAPLFDWNTKQVFLYLYANYSTSRNAVSQVVLWDKIVLRGENPVIDYTDMGTKYPFFDDGFGLKGNKNAKLILEWNVIPLAGLLPRIPGGRTSIDLPEQYSH